MRHSHACALVAFLALAAVLLRCSGVSGQNINQEANRQNINQEAGSAAAERALLVRVLYPEAQLQGGTLWLRGDSLGLSWEQGKVLHHSSADVWELTLHYAAESEGDLLEVKPLIDDRVWKVGANERVRLPVSVPGPGPAKRAERNGEKAANGTLSFEVTLYPWFRSTRGQYHVSEEAIFSPQLLNYRRLVVYTPPSYFENTLQVMDNVLLMHDGQNLFNASTSFGGVAWECQRTVDALVTQGRMAEVLLVGVYNTPDRLNEYTYSYDPSVGAGGKGDLYLDFLEQQVLPYVRRFYRVREDQPSLGVLGSSLGGLISCYAGWTRPAVYSRAGCMSSSFWWNSQDFNSTVMPAHPAPTANLTTYLDSGTCCLSNGNDDFVQTRTVRNHMERLGFEANRNLFYYVDDGGRHNEYYWGERFWVPMTELYPVDTLHPRPRTQEDT
jgi:predicted alpha/beta superfamily hydrolase